MQEKKRDTENIIHLLTQAKVKANGVCVEITYLYKHKEETGPVDPTDSETQIYHRMFLFSNTPSFCSEQLRPAGYLVPC